MKKLFLLLTIMIGSVVLMTAQNKQTGIIKDSLTASGTRIYDYKPVNVCANLITIELDKSGVIKNVLFNKGCDGNVKGIAALIKGMTSEEAIKRLSGIPCGKKATSCPDQLAQALVAIKKIKR